MNKPAGYVFVFQIYDIRYCGSTLPPVIVSNTNSMYIIFFTDDRITGRGFNATYLAVEGMHYVQVGIV